MAARNSEGNKRAPSRKPPAATLAEKNAAYASAVARLTREIEALFREHFPAAFPIQGEDCYARSSQFKGAVYNLAVFIEAARAAKNKGDPGPTRPKMTLMEKAAKAFVREIDAEKQAIAATYPGTLGEPAGAREAALDAMFGLARIDEARGVAATFYEKTPGFDKVAEMGTRVTAALAALGVRHRKRPDEDDALVLLTQKLLEMGRHHTATATIAEKMRGRAGRARSGRGGAKTIKFRPLPRDFIREYLRVPHRFGVR